jgi:hypothetical protein
VLALEPRDLAQMHHRLARSLIEIGQWQEARRQVLMALEEAPRYREAHRTLLEIVQRTENATPVESAAPQVEPEQAPAERTESP